jgi:hypothetical protein
MAIACKAGRLNWTELHRLADQLSNGVIITWVNKIHPLSRPRTGNKNVPSRILGRYFRGEDWKTRHRETAGSSNRSRND